MELGYRLSGVLATGPNLTVGNVNALAGLGDDTRYIQISAPVQPGNGGGTAPRHERPPGRHRHASPAPSATFAERQFRAGRLSREFLDSKLISYKTKNSTTKLPPADVGDIARPFTVFIACTKSERVAAAPSPQRASASAPEDEDVPGGELKGSGREAFIEKVHRSCS